MDAVPGPSESRSEPELKRFSMARNERGFLSAANRVNGGRYDQAVLAGLA